MIVTVRQAFLSSELDEGQMRTCLLCASPYTGLAALGIVVAEVATKIVRDRKTVRAWLAHAEKSLA